MINNENGRSMVEMLGVLAIIGVLSVAGIAGYTMAMNKYKANEIMNAASQVVILSIARHESDSTKTTYTAANAGYTGSIGGVAASDIEANAADKTVTITGFDKTKSPYKEIKAATGCDIGGFSISNCS